MVDSVIILHKSTAVDFKSNGLGSLPDAVSCVVTEERNGEFELEMEYPITGKRYGDLQLRRIILAKSNPYSELQPFRIYSITKPIKGIVTVNAEHISYDMSGYPVSPFTADNITDAFDNMKKACTVSCPFTFMTDKNTEAKMQVLKPTSMRSLLGGVEGSILDTYRGEYEFDRFFVKFWNNRGRNRGVSIRYGKNLTDLNQEENCSTVYTGVYPYWFSDDKGLVQLEEKIVNADGKYDFVRIYPLDLSDVWTDPPTQEQLRAEAKAYMDENQIGIPKVSLTVSFVPLAQTEDYKNFAALETVHLCDTVSVYFPEMKVSASAKCISTTYDVISQKYKKIELGSVKTRLADTIVQQQSEINNKPSMTSTKQAITHAQQSIKTLKSTNGRTWIDLEDGDFQFLDMLYILNDVLHVNGQLCSKTYPGLYAEIGSYDNKPSLLVKDENGNVIFSSYSSDDQTMGVVWTAMSEQNALKGIQITDKTIGLIARVGEALSGLTVDTDSKKVDLISTDGELNLQGNTVNINGHSFDDILTRLSALEGTA